MIATYPHDFIGLFVTRSIRMSFSKSIMEIQQSGTIQLRIMLNTPISCFLWIIYVQLSIENFQSIRWYKSSHKMMKS